NHGRAAQADEGPRDRLAGSVQPDEPRNLRDRLAHLARRLSGVSLTDRALPPPFRGLARTMAHGPRRVRGPSAFPKPTGDETMANYVLVHGAWGGGHYFARLAGELRDAGHEVVVAALTGLGARSDELHPGITLTDHIDDVCTQIEEAGFDRFILAGHSYGGLVSTGVATRLGARIDAIVYIDAFLPGDGQSLWDVTGPFEHDWYIGSQKFTPGLVAPIGSVDFKPVPGQVGRHPLLTLTEAVRYTGEEAKIPRRVYIFAS